MYGRASWTVGKQESGKAVAVLWPHNERKRWNRKGDNDRWQDEKTTPRI